MAKHKNPKVFLSYSSVDQQTADAISGILDGIDIPFFLDRKDINWGESVTSKINDGIEDSSVLIVILSPASLKSQWVPFEIGSAMGTGKTILPFLTHPSLDIPAFINDLHYKSTLQEVSDYFLSSAYREMANAQPKLDRVQNKKGNTSSQKSMPESKLYVCPGCGENSTARNGSLCPSCNRFVHHDCALKGFVNWSCPLCKTGLVGQS